MHPSHHHGSGPPSAARPHLLAQRPVERDADGNDEGQREDVVRAGSSEKPEQVRRHEEVKGQDDALDEHLLAVFVIRQCLFPGQIQPEDVPGRPDAAIDNQQDAENLNGDGDSGELPHPEGLGASRQARA